MDPSASFVKAVLEQPGAVALPGNARFVEDFTGAGGRVQRQISGHLVFYGPGHRRFLMTDPEGHPLHECEWRQTSDDRMALVAARLHLEWGEWVGIRPEGLVNSTSLDLSTRPGWERLTRDDLRAMAARAMNVSPDYIRFFYRDDDLMIDQSGHAIIRQRKDAFYVLHEGRFEEAKFMSCMSRMRWDRIDYLPVVELFLSLLPGTGSAAFELIRGLYDDQNSNNPVPLHYRGIPVYPSEGAFRLFSQFFTASLPGSADPLPVFLDPAHSEEVFWLPCVDPPLRYFDPARNLCVTVKKGKIQKATLADDPSGLSYFSSNLPGYAPFGQMVTVKNANLVLSNGRETREIPINSSWGIMSPSERHHSLQTFPTWHRLFPDGCPPIQAREAFSATLLYPDDDGFIGELESQPFAFDYFEDMLDEEPALKKQMASANQILISQCDASIGSCVRLDRQRSYTILYTRPPVAQKQAQILWNSLARSRQLSWIDSIRFLPYSTHFKTCFGKFYDFLFLWVPFAHIQDHYTLDQTMSDIHNLLASAGIAFIGGSSHLGECIDRHKMEVIHAEYVETLATFRLHQSILPRARLNPELMTFVLRKKP